MKNNSSSIAAPALPFRPERLDVRSFARQQAQLQGQRSLSEFERLREEVFGLSAEDLLGVMVTWSAIGQWREIRGGAAQTWLVLQASVSLPLQCQRCLKTVQQTVKVDRAFHFVVDEATALTLDDESEDDVLVASKTFDLLALIEDELLMAMPIVARHEVCPEPLVVVESTQELTAEQPAAPHKPNPFEALKALKTGR